VDFRWWTLVGHPLEGEPLEAYTSSPRVDVRTPQEVSLEQRQEALRVRASTELLAGLAPIGAAPPGLPTARHPLSPTLHPASLSTLGGPGNGSVQGLDESHVVYFWASRIMPLTTDASLAPLPLLLLRHPIGAFSVSFQVRLELGEAETAQGPDLV